MIYTLTLNPSLDYAMSPDTVKIGKTNRSKKESIRVGGKGINVSIVLKNLGIPSVALGFCGGYVGEAILKSLEEMGVNSDFIRLPDRQSRINVKLMGTEVTEINGNGPEIYPDEINMLYEKLSHLSCGDILVLSGSVPSCLSRDIYADIMDMLFGSGVRIVLDTSGEALKSALCKRPFLVKPNTDELSELFDCQISDRHGAMERAKEICDMGAENVIVSMGEDGSLGAFSDGSCFEINALRGDVKGTVGAGDSLVAGFLAGICVGKDFCTAARLGVAVASATVFSGELANSQETEKYFKMLCE